MNLSEAHVLVVDDEPALLEIYKLWLSMKGCGCIYTAPDGEVALAMANKEPIDLLITDIRMPVMDGITLVRRFAQTGRPIPSVVFVSGFGDVDKREMYDLGVEAFIAKPFDRSELLDVIEKALADRSALWQTPYAVAPRQSLLVEVDYLAEAFRQDTLRLGRGGFSARYSGTLTIGKIAFECLIRADDQRVTGEGYVRWNSPLEQKVGVEFSFVAESCRSWLIAAIRDCGSRSFIPNI